MYNYKSPGLLIFLIFRLLSCIKRIGCGSDVEHIERFFQGE
jgi:hypothetical protein